MCFPLTTTTARIDACNPCEARRTSGMQILGITEASDDPICYTELLDRLGLMDDTTLVRINAFLQDANKNFAAFGKAVRNEAKKMAEVLLPLAYAILEAKRGPAIGRKRRRRRARGRARHQS